MSSKASQLGSGRFGTGARPVSARRAAAAAVTGAPTDGVAPPTELPIERVSLNPDNPRSSFGDLTDLVGSLKEHGQKQAITVMNRDAYATANPGQAAQLAPEITHVVVDGSSRLVAAREAGLKTVKVMVDDAQGADPEAILESALVANIHRQNLSELDEARALERLLTIHKSQRALAKRLHRSQGWVSQRLALLGLAPEMQELIGVEPIEILREVGKAPAAEQPELLERLKREREAKQAAAARVAMAPVSAPEQGTPGVPAESAAPAGSPVPSVPAPTSVPATSVPATSVPAASGRPTPEPAAAPVSVASAAATPDKAPVPAPAPAATPARAQAPVEAAVDPSPTHEVSGSAETEPGVEASVPEPRPTPVEVSTSDSPVPSPAALDDVPWHSPELLVLLAEQHMSIDNFARAARLMANRAVALTQARS